MTRRGPRIVVVPPSASTVAERLARLGGEAEIVHRFDLADTDDERALLAGLDGAWAVVAGGEAYTDAVLGRLPDLRAIVRFGVGYDAIDLAAAGEHGVAVLTTPGANADAVADMTLALILACVRRLPAFDAAVRAGTWRLQDVTRDLTASTVAIVGLGAIGRAVARRLRGFECVLLGVEPDPDPVSLHDLPIELTSLEDALLRADVITLHAPLTQHTRRLLGAQEISLLPAHAVVVNTSRGALIDEQALIDALSCGRLAGAGLDVFEEEPLRSDHPLLSLDNVIVAGHVASFTRLAIDRTCEAIASHLAQLLRGELPPGCLNAPVAGRLLATHTRPASPAGRIRPGVATEEPR